MRDPANQSIWSDTHLFRLSYAETQVVEHLQFVGLVAFMGALVVFVAIMIFQGVIA